MAINKISNNNAKSNPNPNVPPRKLIRWKYFARVMKELYPR